MFLSSSLITVQNLVSVRHTVWMHEGSPKNWGYTGTPLSWIEIVPSPVETRLFPTHTEFGRSTSNHIYGHRYGVIKVFLGRWCLPGLLEWGRGWPSRNTPLPPHMCHLAKLVVLGQTVYERNYRASPGKFDPSPPAFQGHSRSLEPTRIDRLPVTSC